MGFFFAMQMQHIPTTMDRAVVRAKAKGMVHVALGEANEAMASKIEQHAYNWAIDHGRRHGYPLVWELRQLRHIYTTKIVNICQCLKRHPDVRERILTKKIKLHTLVFGKPWEIKPEVWETAFEAAARRQLKSELRNAQSFDGLLTCSKCKSKHVAYCCIQTRAADEPMTVFAECTNCGKRWRTE